MIHWNYIKGLMRSSNGTSLYTYLKFAAEKVNPNDNVLEVENLPSIIISLNDNPMAPTDAGHIITSKAINQVMDAAFTFNDKVTIGERFIDFTSGVMNFNLKDGDAFNIKQTDGTTLFTLHANSTDDAEFLRSIHFKDNVKVEHKINCYDFVAGNECKALFFNATSDKRAKTDIRPLMTNGLDIVKKVQLYTFNYKDGNIPSLGMIAQDLQDLDFNGFKLVDNETATGRDMDYMSIHESKLVYILWKAVQELSAEVEELKKQR